MLDRVEGAAHCGRWGALTELMNKWLPRKTQIIMVETFAAVAVMRELGDLMAERSVTFYIDSEPVQAALVKGYSGKEDLCYLVGLFWHLAADLSVAAYLDRVPTDSNPSDGPSHNNVAELCARGAVEVEACPEALLHKSPSAGPC